MKDIRPLDVVNYHAVIGKPATSFNHIVHSVGDLCGVPVAWVAGKRVAVAIESLTRVFRPVYFVDMGITQDMLLWIGEKVTAEDKAQIKKWGNQVHTADRWDTILGEEVGELSKAMLEQDLVEIEKEGIQAATLALKIAWMAKRMREENNG